MQQGYVLQQMYTLTRELPAINIKGIVWEHDPSLLSQSSKNKWKSEEQNWASENNTLMGDQVIEVLQK